MKENNLNSQYGKVWTCSWRIIIDKLFLLLGELLELVTELYDSNQPAPAELSNLCKVYTVI